MVGPLQVGGEEEHQGEDHARKRQNDNEQEARHIASIVAEFVEVALCACALVESRIRMKANLPTVLVVDDDRQILGLVEKMLRPQGVTVLSANKPSEALRICEAQPVDVLISDVMMPDMDGGRLAERFLQLRPQGRVMLISGQSKMPSAAKLPNVRFLRKPFFPSVLVQQLRELMEGG